MFFNGIDNIDGLGVLKGKRLGLITNPTGVNASLISTASILQNKFQLCAVFGPEHGIRGDQQAGVEINGMYVDQELGVPSYSLYGKNSVPTAEMLEGLDALVYDIQDVGARFYTYIYTMAHAMEACAKHGLEFIVLDRCNPLGGLNCEGILLDSMLKSGVGEFPIPVRYGMTAGEFARYINAEFNMGCHLEVVPCLGWKRSMWHAETGQQWIMPSPNIPTSESALVYIGTCIFEGTDISEGRGTTRPFEIIGAPQLDAKQLAAEMSRFELAGVLFRPVHFTPTFSKHAGSLCHGVQVHVTERDSFMPFECGLRLFECVCRQYPELQCNQHLDNLLGTCALRNKTKSVDEIISSARQDSASFLPMIEKYGLYSN